MSAPPSPRDYATCDQRHLWWRDPVLGDPSFDAFRRHPANPIHRGAPPLEWPVNGFLFRDPPSGRWYVYVGHYSAGYAMGPGKGMICTAYESRDDGGTWRHTGPVFDPAPFVFEGSDHPADYAPDVSVVYEDGRYHMAFDGVCADATGLRDGASGVGYACGAAPTGPFERRRTPLVRNESIRQAPLLDKYDRLYATTLLRRDGDWLLLVLADSGPCHSWALVGLAAARPEGPYGDPVVLLHTEHDRFQPPLMEYFPAFVHAGWVYAPSTSVARNRNFQLLHRAPLAQALCPEAWELAQHGSLWHAEAVEHEAAGIWGQTLSGCVDPAGDLRVMFPSRDGEGRGTINLAARPWATPYRPRGFGFSGHGGASITTLRRAWSAFRARVELRLGGRIALLWGMQGPMGSDTVRADASPHRSCRTRCRALELSADRWRLLELDAAGAETVLAAGGLAAGGTAGSGAARLAAAALRQIDLEQGDDGDLTAKIGGEVLCRVRVPVQPGRIGLWAAPASWVDVSSFVVTGAAGATSVPLLYTDALLGAGQSMADWDEVTDVRFRYGVGAVHRGEGGRAKWSFVGTGFRLWSPRGPGHGRVTVRLDGEPLDDLDLHAKADAPSAPVLVREHLAEGLHAVTLVADGAPLPVDSLEALQQKGTR